MIGSECRKIKYDRYPESMSNHYHSPRPLLLVQVAPIIKGVEGCTDEPPLVLPPELSWAEGNETIATTLAFVAAEAKLMGVTFASSAVRAYMESWISRWDGGQAPIGSMEKWLQPAVSGRQKFCIFTLADCCCTTYGLPS